MNANVWANFFPLIILLMTIGYGASAIAGQEKDGHLELVLSLPVLAHAASCAQKIGVLTLQALILCSSSPSSPCSSAAGSSSTFGIWELTTATARGGSCWGSTSVCSRSRSGPATGNRGMALGVASTVAAASYLVSSMAPVIDAARAAAVPVPLLLGGRQRSAPGGALVGVLRVLLGVAIVLSAIALAAFERHDIS